MYGPCFCPRGDSDGCPKQTHRKRKRMEEERALTSWLNDWLNHWQRRRQPLQNDEQLQRLEVAVAALLVHAASCKNAACPVPHCKEMKILHSHLLKCNTVGCPVCKELGKPLTYIHAKYCVAAPGERTCVIPYCARAERELQVLMQQRQQQEQRSLGGCSMTGMSMGGAGAGTSGIGTLFGCQGSGASSGPLAPNGLGGLAAGAAGNPLLPENTGDKRGGEDEGVDPLHSSMGLGPEHVRQLLRQESVEPQVQHVLTRLLRAELQAAPHS